MLLYLQHRGSTCLCAAAAAAAAAVHTIHPENRVPMLLL